MFTFHRLLDMAMNGIDGTSIIPAVTNIAFAILLVGFLIGLYQAALRGGDVQALAVTAIKYLVVAMIIANWSTVFRDVNGSFNNVAEFIGSTSGAGDMFSSWMNQLQQQAATNPNLTFWDMITGDLAGSISVGLLLVAYVLYALAIIVFCFFYTLYGSVLYVVGPLVLALIPISGVGQLARTFGTNVMIWNAWALLYAIFGALITAVQVNRVNDILGHGFLGFLLSAPDSTMLGLVSIFYALSVVLIPFIAKRIISGDAGSTAFAMVRAGELLPRAQPWPESAGLPAEPVPQTPVLEAPRQLGRALPAPLLVLRLPCRPRCRQLPWRRSCVRASPAHRTAARALCLLSLGQPAP